MIGYVTLGTNDITRSTQFYDELLAEMGAKRLMQSDTFVAWAITPDQCGLAVTQPFDGNVATAGNGVMVALAANTPEQVDKLHAKALALGGSDEGAVGFRGEKFYAGYFRDIDGNKLNFFCMT